MSLVKHPVITPEKLAANQANARQSQGPTSPEGVQRIREAATKHGYYSKAPRDAMRALGEDPLELDRLLEALMDFWQPESEYEASLVERLARAMWRLGRTDRIHEGMTVYQMELQERRLERQEREDAAEHKERTGALERLLHSAEHVDFHPGEPEWNDLHQLFDPPLTGRAQRICLRAMQLQRPEDGNPPAEGKPPAPAWLKEKERESVRAELRKLLREEIEAQNQEYRQRRDQRAQEASTAFRDAYMAPSHPQAGLMLRVENSAFQQLRQLHGMLTKLKAERSNEPQEQAKNSADKSHDVDENKEDISGVSGKSHDVIENKGPTSEGV
jgi:hypothetical protein